MVLVQSSFHTTWASLFEMELESNLLDWNVNELELELELEDMKRTYDYDFDKKNRIQSWSFYPPKKTFNDTLHKKALSH